ncbi:hypothetical protein [Leekyejoonella antrihumi]|uniref:Uncharacterized protein n=1 Tax=Leekyejoonella antrihumi TaxID=1660198 RepID=A0A563DRQ5_9MICO|nr:hypothetical protein [Leekyejoonella antrihumi]TWP32920.1 hypothetical protein FGL98_23035 [Leekyejoonella antrihumi]
MTFLSNRPRSGDDVTWTETLGLGTDPAAAPTATAPGKDVSHWSELSPAPWFSMAMCDPDPVSRAIGPRALAPAVASPGFGQHLPSGAIACSAVGYGQVP